VSLLDFETAMTIADYTAIGVLIVLAIWAGVTLYLRGSYNAWAASPRWPRCAWPIKTNLCLTKAGSNRIGIGIIARAIAARAGAMDSNANDFAETHADILTFDIPDDAPERAANAEQAHTWAYCTHPWYYCPYPQ
jgi:hypothetical protein